MHLQGETWQAVIKGHELDPMSQQQDQQRLLLERFQREVRPGVSSWCLAMQLHPDRRRPGCAWFAACLALSCHVMSAACCAAPRL